MRVEVLKRCPYINAYGSNNSNVSWIRKVYDDYEDYIEFENGKPVKCTRTWKGTPDE